MNMYSFKIVFMVMKNNIKQIKHNIIYVWFERIYFVFNTLLYDFFAIFILKISTMIKGILYFLEIS